MKQQSTCIVVFLMIIFSALAYGQETLPSAPDPQAPLTLKGRFAYAGVQTFGPYKIAEIAAMAGYDQWMNDPKEWGEGGEGFGKRFASGYGYAVVRQTLELGMEVGLHQDPRYFPSKKKGFLKRTGCAIAETFVARGDSGHNQVAWARLVSAGGAAGIGNLWQPTSTRTVGYAFESFGFILGGDAGYNWVQEFFPFFRPKESRGL